MTLLGDDVIDRVPILLRGEEKRTITAAYQG